MTNTEWLLKDLIWLILVVVVVLSNGCVALDMANDILRQGPFP